MVESYTFARAACPLLIQKARWGLIEIDGREAGIVQIFEAGFLWNALHAVIIDRGPLWFDGFGSAVHVKLFFSEMNRSFPPRLGRRRRFLPETEDGPTAQKIIGQTGLIPANDASGYQTIWLDLSEEAESIRAKLQQKWRNSLGKAERSGLRLEWDTDGEHLPWALTHYAVDKEARGYGGASPELLRAYAPLLAARGDLLLGRASLGGEGVAFVLLACHGRSATYLAGWNAAAGRDACAHHLLLWEGALMLQQKGIKELDLGGINDESAAGIKSFKEGMGGQIVRYVGRHT